MVEIEIGILRRPRLVPRIDDPSGSTAKSPPGNGRGMPRSGTKWVFIMDKARVKIGRAYPDTSKESNSSCRSTGFGGASPDLGASLRSGGATFG